MSPRVREAQAADVPALVSLMAASYEEAGFPLQLKAADRAFSTVLGDSKLGRVWMVEIDDELTGYLVVTFGFSMEYGGLRGFVDDFFVLPNARGSGLGMMLLETVKRNSLGLGVRVLVVETGPSNHPARPLYARAGFSDSGRVLLRHALARALHEA